MIIDGIPTVVGSASDSIILTVIDGSPPSPEELVQELIDSMNDITFIKPQAHNAMMNKLHALQKLIEEGNYSEAFDKLQYDIALKLTLGNKHSWIITGDVADIIDALLEALS